MFVNCAVPEKLISIPTPQKVIGNSKGVGGTVLKAKLFKAISMGLNWNFQRGGGIQTKTPSVGGVWIFSGTTHCEIKVNSCNKNVTIYHGNFICSSVLQSNSFLHFFNEFFKTMCTMIANLSDFEPCICMLSTISSGPLTKTNASSQ